MCLNYPAARFLHGGGSNIITIRREPHCGHFRRLSSEDGGKRRRRIIAPKAWKRHRTN